MTTLVVGATGATGRLLVEQLLDRQEDVRVIVRSAERLPKTLRGEDGLTVTQASLLDLSDADLAEQVRGCDAVASCLGHNLSFKGIYGKPRRLVTDAARRLCEAIRSNGPEAPVRYVLMNTVGNRNRDLDEKIPFGDRLVVGILRGVLPPQSDNEQAADYLRTVVGQGDGMIEWAAVRPDSLIDEDEVTEYRVIPSLTSGPLSGPEKTSRINVAHFMAELITDDETWAHWRGHMPVIYDSRDSSY